jgi:regulatory protein
MALPESSPVVSRLERIPRKGEYLVIFSDGTELRILKDDLEAAGIEEGVSLDRDTIARLDAAYRYARARQAALRLLKVRPRTELELRRRLGALKSGPETANGVIEDLKTEGAVDDRTFTRLWIEEKIRKGDTGRLRILRDLEDKGVPREVVSRQLKESFSRADEAEAARALALKRIGRMGNEPTRVAKEKVFAYLLRRGFASELASEAAREAAQHSRRTDEDEV